MAAEQERYVQRLRSTNPEYYRLWMEGWKALVEMDEKMARLETDFFKSDMGVESYQARFRGIEEASGLRMIDIAWREGLDLGPQFDPAVFEGKIELWRRTLEEICQRFGLKSLDWRIRFYGVDGTLPGRLGYVITVTNLAEACGCEKRRFAECLKMIRRLV